MVDHLFAVDGDVKAVRGHLAARYERLRVLLGEGAVQQEYGLKFWSSEDYSTVGDWAGAACWGRLLNQNFVRMNQTSTISWSLIWSVYASGFPYFGNGLMCGSCCHGCRLVLHLIVRRATHPTVLF